MGLLCGPLGAQLARAIADAVRGCRQSHARSGTSWTSRRTASSSVGARGIYAAIITTLGGTPRFHKAALIPQAQDALATERDERGKRVVVVLDEAHLLGADQLEELRLLL